MTKKKSAQESTAESTNTKKKAPKANKPAMKPKKSKPLEADLTDEKKLQMVRPKG